jgi:hypothetical protein
VVILLVDALVAGGFWLLQAARERFPALIRVQDADAAFDRENPDIVVVVKRRSDWSSNRSSTFGQILLK